MRASSGASRPIFWSRSRCSAWVFLSFLPAAASAPPAARQRVRCDRFDFPFLPVEQVELLVEQVGPLLDPPLLLANVLAGVSTSRSSSSRRFRSSSLALKLRLHADRLCLAVGVGKNLVGKPPGRLGAEPSPTYMPASPPSMPTISPISPPIIGPSTSPPGLSSSGLRHIWTRAGVSLGTPSRNPEVRRASWDRSSRSENPEGCRLRDQLRERRKRPRTPVQQLARLAVAREGPTGWNRGGTGKSPDVRPSDYRSRAGDHAGIVHATGGWEL